MGAHMCLRNCKTDYRFRFEMIVFQEISETKCQPVKIRRQNIEQCQRAQSTPTTTKTSTTTKISTTTTTKTSTTNKEKTTGYDEIHIAKSMPSNTTKKQKIAIDAQGSPIVCDGSFCNSEVSLIFQQFYCIIIAIFMLHLGQV